VSSGGSQRPSAGTRPSKGTGTAQLPSGNRPSAGTGSRPSKKPSIGTKPSRGDAATRPGNKPSQLPAKGSGNFLGAAAGVGAGAALGASLGNRPSQLPSDRRGTGEARTRPEQRPNWNQRAQNRDSQWRDRVDNRSEAWDKRSEQRQQRRDDFQKNRDERWDKLESAREDRQEWRDQRREDWQQHREDLWDYRAERADEIWDNAQDFYDDVFDDAWWGYWGWGGYWPGYYPLDPWWWWGAPTWNSVVTYTSVPSEPVYTDYGMNVIYEGDTVYVDGKAMPTEQYDGPILKAAQAVEQPPPPLPPSDPKQPGDWMPLGVFALAQEERGDPVMFFQLSINREGVISGAFQSTLTNESKQIAGKVDKATQRAAWRIGDNDNTIYETTLANLTQEVSAIAIHFDAKRTQTWLLVRMPAPAPAGQEQKLPQAPKSPPPLKANMNAAVPALQRTSIAQQPMLQSTFGEARRKPNEAQHN
jgi:hypothetical protein